jgi:hypothetical protein
MAVVTQTILDGPRNVVVKIASTGSDTDQIVVDVSALSPACTKLTLEQIWGSIAEGGLATFEWDATTDVVICHVAGGSASHRDYRSFGGITNNAGTGITGDVLLTTTAHAGSYVLSFKKAGVIDRS